MQQPINCGVISLKKRLSNTETLNIIETNNLLTIIKIKLPTLVTINTFGVL